MMLLDDGCCNKLNRYPTPAKVRKTNTQHNASGLGEKTIRGLRQKEPAPSRIYWLPIIHKQGVSHRSTVSNIGSFT